MLMTLCPKCAAKMKENYYMKETSAPFKARCVQCIEPSIKTVTQYDLTSKRHARPRPAPSGPPKRDARARYKEPWRERT